MELKTYKLQVRSIMEEHEKARNVDWSLIAFYIAKHKKKLLSTDGDGDLVIKLKNLQYLPAVETFTKSRRIIQNQNGEFLPTDPKVVKARKIKEENIRNIEHREAVLEFPKGKENVVNNS